MKYAPVSPQCWICSLSAASDSTWRPTPHSTIGRETSLIESSTSCCKIATASSDLPRHINAASPWEARRNIKQLFERVFGLGNRRSTLLRQIAKADLLIIDDFGLPHRISEG
jgi:hypothetical protein